MEMVMPVNYVEMTDDEMMYVDGGGYKYYGNGLYVDVKNGKYYVNWGQTVDAQFNRWATNGNGRA
ncbi:MAG: Bacteriocin-type signal sequence-containing protein [Lactococcus sp.]|jgi:hypothetical protein